MLRAELPVHFGDLAAGNGQQAVAALEAQSGAGFESDGVIGNTLFEQGLARFAFERGKLFGKPVR